MPSTQVPHERSNEISWIVQAIAWSLGLVACLAGMLGRVSEWDSNLATVQFLWLLLAPIVMSFPKRRLGGKLDTAEVTQVTSTDWSLAIGCAILSFAMSAWIGSRIGDLPPAYHDEFSYVFQAKTLLAGRFSFPSPPVQPELFNQMHVLNEGRMASRYYPGTGAWLAPFVAICHPYWAPWSAGALATFLLYWIGRETSGRMAGMIASLSMALSPGMGLFGNLLLAHHPTLLGLSLFLLGVIRLHKSRRLPMGMDIENVSDRCQKKDSTILRDALLAGIGLSYAMLCRPMTAAGVGFPFGLEILWWLVTGRSSPKSNIDDRSGETHRDRETRRWQVLIGMACPLVVGWIIMLAYNHDVTGKWMTSPYQLYTDIYTPRHVFGFDNVVRGEKRLGPKVIEHYDKWAENLTLTLAASNAVNRWIGSWTWGLDGLTLLSTFILTIGAARNLDSRCRLVLASIFCLHLVHVPYWYVGIMGWHYVFETIPLWLLLFGTVSVGLFQSWESISYRAAEVWWVGLISISIVGTYVGIGGFWDPRIDHGINALIFPRQQQAVFRHWIVSSISERPALVLVDQSDVEASHLDFVTNSPGLSDEILIGRFIAEKIDLNSVIRDFPNRTVYVASWNKKLIQKVGSP